MTTPTTRRETTAPRERDGDTPSSSGWPESPFRPKKPRLFKASAEGKLLPGARDVARSVSSSLNGLQFLRAQVFCPSSGFGGALKAKQVDVRASPASPGSAVGVADKMPGAGL